ncbi:hypothetical protein A5788_13700 [Gordonia sp. 852002-50816_SCH5313054-c]|nr:hypothetical protein A5785_10170 [Gordonia sp. 852002-50395_SCH5434458]OBC11677.1 hypothetical protein A5786_03615 [Gordonia sp. 852002-50816_SCH5313054-a]OBC16742.1 hypothetical protein A5788_13700 [Gordonia sp. 852002-50816_SCH5313054-c]
MRMPAGPTARSVWGYTMATSEILPLMIHILVLLTHRVTAVAFSVGAHAGRIRAEVWFSQTEAADRFARGRPR